MIPVMSYKVQVLLSVTTLGITALGLWFWQQRKKAKNYVQVGRVKQLFFYPVKTLKGIEVQQVHCTNRGIEVNGVLERSYMAVDDKGVLISQREEPRLVLLTPSISGNCLLISGPNVETLKIKIKTSVSKDDVVIDCKIHGDMLKAVDCGNEAAIWFQKFLDRKDVHLVCFVPEVHDRRYVDNNPVFEKYRKKNPITFQDAAPFHLACQSSFDFVNAKLDEKISILNFRPNIVIEGSEAFDEDNWKFMKFSSGVEIQSDLPCGRCILTTNNPETGVKSKEPLATLRKFRMAKDKHILKLMKRTPGFGLHCSLTKSGDIHVGDSFSAVIEQGLFKF